jgi:hypothetical protein
VKYFKQNVIIKCAVSTKYVKYVISRNISFRSHSLFYPLTVGVEVVCFHFITLRHTPQSVGLLWTRDRPAAETSTRQHKHCTRDKHPCPRSDSKPRSQQPFGLDLRLRPRGHWDRLLPTSLYILAHLRLFIFHN